MAGDASRAARGRLGNYSLFLTQDGLLIGYLETGDYRATLDPMAQTEVNERWQAVLRQGSA